MPNLEQYVNFSPEKEIPDLDGKVIFITGGSSLVHSFFINWQTEKKKKNRNLRTGKSLSDSPSQAQPGAYLLYRPQQPSSTASDQ